MIGFMENGREGAERTKNINKKKSGVITVMTPDFFIGIRSLHRSEAHAARPHRAGRAEQNDFGAKLLVAIAD